MKKKFIQPSCLVSEMCVQQQILTGSEGGYVDIPVGGTTTKFGARDGNTGHDLDLDVLDL